MKPVTIDGNNVPYAKDAKILRLKLGTNEYSKHIKDINTGLLSILSEILCSILDNRDSRIYLLNYQGPRFSIGSDVPQGSSISSTLYSLYTYDLPFPITRLYQYNICRRHHSDNNSLVNHRKCWPKKIEVTKVND